VSPSPGTAFQQLEWPVSYLDFETVISALPLYNDGNVFGKGNGAVEDGFAGLLRAGFLGHDSGP